MNGSLANIVFNSTTVIESLLSRSNTIFPIYHEAKEEFSREIYFKNHLNLFSLAESEEKLEDLISKSIKGKELKKINFSDISSLCNEQLGNSDGKSAKRFFDNIREILSPTPPVLCLSTILLESKYEHPSNYISLTLSQHLLNR